VATCPSSPTCQVYCEPGYLLNSAGTACLRAFTVAPVTDTTGDNGGNCTAYYSSDCVVETNDKSIPSFCGAPNSVVQSISVTASPAGQPTTTPLIVSGDGCQNPSSGTDEGEPGDTCEITVTFTH
jgi:hypothetical protein